MPFLRPPRSPRLLKAVLLNTSGILRIYLLLTGWVR